MNQHYKQAVIYAAVDLLEEQEGTVNIDILNEQMEDPCWDEELNPEEHSFEGDVSCLMDLYYDALEHQKEEEEPVKSKEEQLIDETCEQLHLGFNFVPGIGVGYCRDEEDLEAMRNFVRGGMAAQLLARIFG